VTYQLDLPYQKTPTISLTLKKGDQDHSVTVSDGTGPIDAAFLAVTEITGLNLECKEYQVRSSSLGRDAQGQVTVQVECEGETHRGQAVSMDCIEASIKAILNSVNRILDAQQQPQGEVSLEVPRIMKVRKRPQESSCRRFVFRSSSQKPCRANSI
jgi:2-isopropylmalate synthase